MTNIIVDFEGDRVVLSRYRIVYIAAGQSRLEQDVNDLPTYLITFLAVLIN